MVYAMICLTDVCAMLHFVMLYHFARMVKLGVEMKKILNFFLLLRGREGGREE